MKNITLCIPAIVDFDLISENVKSIKKNFIDCNSNFNFNVFVNVDDYKRENSVGIAEEILDCYETLNCKNCKVDVNISNPRLGINMSYRYLLEKFVNSDGEYCIYFDEFCLSP